MHSGVKKAMILGEKTVFLEEKSVVNPKIVFKRKSF